MSDMSGAAASAGQTSSPGAAAGGMPDESDLPSIQGLDDSVDDPSDPEAAQRGTDEPDAARFAALSDAGEGKGTSDPMPDMSGTGT